MEQIKTRYESIVTQMLGHGLCAKEGTGNNVQITDWTPNNVKTIIVSGNYLIVEYYVCKKETCKHGIKQKVMYYRLTNNTETKGKSVLSIIEEPRVLSAVEEIILLQDEAYKKNVQILQQDMQYLQRFISAKNVTQRFPRLRYVAVVQGTIAQIQQKKAQGSKQHISYIEELKKDKVTMQILYKNPEWWRYGEENHAPLRPQYYLFDAYPKTENEEVRSTMLLHKCFTQIAKEYYEAERQKKECEQQTQQMQKVIQRIEQANAWLEPMLIKTINLWNDTIKMARQNYQANKGQASVSKGFVEYTHIYNWDNQNIKKLVQQAYIINTSNIVESSYAEWYQRHSKGSKQDVAGTAVDNEAIKAINKYNKQLHDVVMRIYRCKTLQTKGVEHLMILLCGNQRQIFKMITEKENACTELKSKMQKSTNMLKPLIIDEIQEQQWENRVITEKEVALSEITEEDVAFLYDLSHAILIAIQYQYLEFLYEIQVDACAKSLTLMSLELAERTGINETCVYIDGWLKQMVQKVIPTRVKKDLTKDPKMNVQLNKILSGENTTGSTYNRRVFGIGQVDVTTQKHKRYIQTISNYSEKVLKQAGVTEQDVITGQEQLYKGLNVYVK